PGGFSQYIRVPKINVEYGTYKLPSHLSFEEGTVIEPLGCVVRGQRLAGIAKDDCVLIVGSGMTGLLHLKLARQKGVERIILADINPYRIKLAEKFNADFAVDSRDLPQKLRELNDGRLADKVIVCSGAMQASLTALECVDRGGTILFFAVPDPTVKIQIPLNRFWRYEITLKTSYGAAPNDLDESLLLLARKKIEVKDMITHRLSLKEINEGFSLVSRSEKSLKVIIEPNRP
ncbi:zinc-binding dehydrogenase, partial [Candidatus Bathyarchaeota archaeon]|nr:zinc-binding dehydrogenase [Candidatus Bathyarchaeota archaeon]